MLSVPGRYLLPYIPDIVGVLELTTPLIVKEASQLTGAIARNTLRSLTLICPTDYKVVTDFSHFTFLNFTRIFASTVPILLT